MLRTAKNFLSNIKLLIFLLACAVGKQYGPVVFKDPDTGWHIATGYYIRKLGTIPQHDPWSYASGEQVWYNISWLWDVALSFVHQHSSLNTTYNILVMIYALFLVYLYKALKEVFKVEQNDAIWATLTLSALLNMSTMYLRPQVVSYFFCLHTMIVLEKYLNKGPRLLIHLLLTTIAWVNLHGTFPLLWAISGLYFIDYVLQKNWRLAINIASASTICLGATLLNPLGIGVYQGILRTLNSVVLQYIMEWKPYTFSLNYDSSMALCLMLVIGIVHNQVAKRFKMLAAFSLLISLLSIRNWPLFGILSAPFIALSLSAIRQNLKMLPINNLINHWFVKSRFIFSALLLVLTAYEFNHTKPLYQGANSIDSIRFVVANYPGARVFNEYGAGGSIIFYGGGRIRHFIDGRAGTCFSEEMMRMYLNCWQSPHDIASLFKKYPAEVAIVPKNHLIFTATRDFFSSWYRVFNGAYSEVFVKNPPVAKPIKIQ